MLWPHTEHSTRVQNPVLQSCEALKPRRLCHWREYAVQGVAGMYTCVKALGRGGIAGAAPGGDLANGGVV